MTDKHVAVYFEEQARTVRSHLAVRTLTDSMTYQQLDEHANGVAEELRRLGAADTRVALLTDQEPRGCAALIGILKSGATFVPISQTDPPDRVLQIIEDSGARVIVTHAPYLERMASPLFSRIQVLDYGDVAPVGARRFPLPDANHLASILYTSGSTGRPKGVMRTSAMSSYAALAWRRTLEITSNDRVTLFATFATGQGSTMTLLALLSGATLCPFKVREEGIIGLSSWLRAHRITVYGSSVTLFRSLAKNLGDGVDYPDLRLIRIGGERVTPHDIELARRHFPNAELFHTYSATETGNIAMYRVPRNARLATDATVPVGRPSEGVRIRILSDAGRDVPVGEVGEIVISSPRLSLGYWNDPDRTAQVFRPLADAPGERVCRIGDLGRLRPDGALEHHGRKDFRVKIRGFRIELEEIESFIVGHPAVARVAAAARPQANGVDLALVAYITIVDGARLTPEAIRLYLADRLPGHMVPAQFIFLDDFPLTASGKINRTALPDPSCEGRTRSQEFVAPRTPLETSIAEVWKEVLDLDAVGVHDHFLEIGGDSLRATQVAARLRDVVQIEVPLRDLFEAATVAELAVAMEDAQQG